MNIVAFPPGRVRSSGTFPAVGTPATVDLALRSILASIALIAALVLSGCSGQIAYNPELRAGIGSAPWTIKAENKKPGTTAWLISNPAYNREIEGYASLTSVNRGGDIRIYVNTAEPTYSMEFYRVGWYGGTGGREVSPRVERVGVSQPMPAPDPTTGLVECNWTDPYVLHIGNSADPTNWASGIYLVKLTAGSSGKQSYVTFVVRDDQRSSDLMFQASVTTYEAYNDWGGWSLYSQPRAYRVSFNRPYSRGDGSGDLLIWEINLVRFLEREGYDVIYSTDVDTHVRGALLMQHNAFLSVGHDEYWSWQMRDNVEKARDSGVNLGFFGADAAYWQIRFASSALTGDANRTIVCYKSETLDPMALVPASINRTTTLFRNKPVNRPENKMMGVMYESWFKEGAPNEDVVISEAGSWVFAGTGLRNGDHLKGLLGYEADRIYNHAPDATVRLAHSPYRNDAGRRLYSDMAYYVAPSGSTVVALGSTDWSWGLDGFGLGHPDYTSPAAQQIARNILQRFGATDPAKIAVP